MRPTAILDITHDDTSALPTPNKNPSARLRVRSTGSRQMRSSIKVTRCKTISAAMNIPRAAATSLIAVDVGLGDMVNQLVEGFAVRQCFELGSVVVILDGVDIEAEALGYLDERVGTVVEQLCKPELLLAGVDKRFERILDDGVDSA